MSKKDIDAAYAALTTDVISELDGDGRLVVIQAPPGSGKTHTLLAVVSVLVEKGRRVGLAAQTNRQADDIVMRWSRDYPMLAGTRLAAGSSRPPADLPSQITWVTKPDDLPGGAGLFISTTAKWTLVSVGRPFDVLAIDEGWQMAWGDLMQCAPLSEKFLMIGDPGQIAPVVSVDVRRWATAPRPPHKAAPEVAMGDPDLRGAALIGSLPACRRLPAESVKYVKPFYSFDFVAYADPGERSISFDSGHVPHALQDVMALVGDGAPVLVTIPTPEQGILGAVDRDIATHAVDLARALVESKAHMVATSSGEPRPISPKDIGICATHRDLVGEITKALGPKLGGVQVDTPERWQGLERPIMIAIHPLSGVTDATDFDLDTGRLCVMASRHTVALIMLSRDHVGQTLEAYIPSAAQAPGEPDAVGQGHLAHSRFWTELADDGRIVALT